MEAVGDLDRLWGATCRRIGVGARAVATHDGDARVGGQPFGDLVGVALRQQRGDAMAFQINDNRAIADALAPGPLIEANDARVLRRRKGDGADKAK